MSNSKLFSLIIGILTFIGLIILTKGILILILVFLSIMMYIVFCFLECDRNQYWFDRLIPYKWNFVIRFNDFLDSFPQIIKNAKKDNKKDNQK